MSTFDNPEYKWRETFFLFHSHDDRPLAADIEQALKAANPRFEIRELHSDDDGKLTSMTLIAPETFSAMDLSYAESDDLAEQIAELRQELTATDDDEREKMCRISDSDMRLDLLHFEQMSYEIDDDGEMDAFFDPGALILVISTIADMCHGVGVDPASATIV
jgi:hypothetical protein